MIIGNSKTKPVANVVVFTVPMYEFTLISFLITSETENVDKKFNDKGVKTKYPKATPKKNYKEEITMNFTAFLFSFLYKAGLMKFQNCNKI